MKMFVWDNPYRVSYGTSMLIAVAESEEEARTLAIKGVSCSYGTPDAYQPEDWSNIVEKLGRPCRVVDLPCAEWHMWQE